MKLLLFSLFSLLFGLLSCNNNPVNGPGQVRLYLFDVGQGLSQVVSIGNEAIVFDIGASDGWNGWIDGYTEAGKPQIVGLIISHTDLDHCGALSMFDSNIVWNGQIYCGYNCDTSYIRQISALAWQTKINFSTFKSGDTISLLSGVELRCLWPSIVSQAEIGELSTNQLSAVFSLRHKNASLLITSDIDTIIEKKLAVEYGHDLKTDILIVPHHGSASSGDPVFFGYVVPDHALISCGVGNSYGHPSMKMVQLITAMGIPIYNTSEMGTLKFCSNGWYWNKF